MKLTRLLGVGAIALALVSTSIAVEPPQIAQAGSCTGWTSRVYPPKTIRVYNNRTGRIKQVGFKTYVLKVMASGEWPSYLPLESLKVGAVAVKQYAWYYMLKGHHRSWYKTRSGKCYDVQANTTDALFHPYVQWTPKQLKAVEATWGLSLRKRGRFFLTGWRAWGSDCGKPVDGWRLYEGGVTKCAKKGWSYLKIQDLYYGKNFTRVWAPGSEPDRRITMRPANKAYQYIPH